MILEGGENMVPLTSINLKEVKTIKQIIGKEKIKTHLYSLGFTEGCEIIVLSKIAGSLIVRIKEARIAISKEMANSIVVR